MSDEANTDDQNTDFDDEFNKIAGEKAGQSDDAVENLDNPDEDPSPDDKSKAQEDTPGDGDEYPVPDEDPYAGMDEATKNRFIGIEEEKNKLQHQIDSDNGRVSAFQRKINDLQKVIDSAANTSNKEQPSNKEISDAMATDEDWDSFKEDYPEVAEAIDSRLNAAMNSQEEKINTQIAPVLEKQEENAMIDAYGEVAKDYPEWQNAVKEKSFDDWIEQQPLVVQSLAASDDPEDASSLIGLYDTYLVANGKPSIKANPDNDTGVTNADELADKRQRQLEDGATIPSKTARIGSDDAGGEDEFERSFNAYAARKEANKT